MKCPYCDRPAKWVDNAEIYGRRYGKSYMMWWCKPCDALVGCHNNTEKPLGTLANKELRNWRRQAHAVFDPSWKLNPAVSRRRAYVLLAEHFGKPIHIGESDIQTCKEIIYYCMNSLEL